MPPFNAARRDRLADAAIVLLAQEGARGLTHRAVDAAAGEPAGTTSRYFRTRDALLHGTVARIRELHFADLARAPRGPVGDRAVGEHLAGMVQAAVTVNRARHLAMAELFLEGTRRPDLRAALNDTRTAQIKLMREVHLAAGLELDEHRAAMLVTAITGVVLVALTTPEAIGVHSPADLRDVVLDTVARVRAPAT